MKNALHLSFVLTIFVLASVSASAQQLKKKNLGLYTGTIASYSLLSGEQVLEVNSATIQIEIKADKIVTETIGASQSNGTYTLVSENKTEIVLSVVYPNTMQKEELILSKKTHVLQRKGFYPQPDCNLTKN